MSDEVKVNRVRSSAIGVPGRCLNSARTNHFVLDDPTAPEAPTPAEAFLAGISGCAVLIVDSTARQSGVPLHKAEVTIEGVRRVADMANFQSVNLRFELIGPTPEQAHELVATYQSR
ncbi:MAG: OsmC family protein [Chloroflexi bacterium]|nr:OsmC family protein [Chloroflexota bacterium]